MRWNAIIVVFSLITFCSTMAGGLFTLRFKAKLHYFLAFSAGALIAIAFLDLLPQASSIALESDMTLRAIFLTVVVGFVAYHLLEKLILIHTHAQEEGEHEHIMGVMGSSAMIGHSFLDGVAIGTGFQTNFHLGMMIGLAVIMHDFADGTNTVSILLQSKSRHPKTLMFLLYDAAAPMAGVLSTLLFAMPVTILALMLAWFAGEFIYLGAADLLPSAHSLRSSKKTLVATIVAPDLLQFSHIFLRCNCTSLGLDFSMRYTGRILLYIM